MIAGLLTRVMFYSEIFGGGRRGGNNQQSQAAMIEMGVLLVSVVVYFISFMLTMALSRYRELAADRSGALLIGRPSLLASALVKITGEMGRIPTKDLRAAEPFNAFFFAPAVANGATQGERRGLQLRQPLPDAPDAREATRPAGLAGAPARPGRPGLEQLTDRWVSSTPSSAAASRSGPTSTRCSPCRRRH